MQEKRKFEDYISVSSPAASHNDTGITRTIRDATPTEITRSIRDAPPADYTLKIKSFSELSDIVMKSGVDKYESADFESSGYKWKLLLYPNGNSKRYVGGHISLYLALAETTTIPQGFQIDTSLKFFVYDCIQDKYLTIQDGSIKRYHALKTEHGFDQLLPLTMFSDYKNGYLMDDCCAFGVEVHVIKYTGKGEECSIIKEPYNRSYAWKINKFSKLDKNYLSSEVFTLANYKWKMLLSIKGKYISLSLKLDDNNIQPRVYAEFILLLKDQVREKHFECKGANWFIKCENTSIWGFSTSMLLSQLYNGTKGFLVNDTLIVEAKITRISSVQGLSG